MKKQDPTFVKRTLRDIPNGDVFTFYGVDFIKQEQVSDTVLARLVKGKTSQLHQFRETEQVLIKIQNIT